MANWLATRIKAIGAAAGAVVTAVYLAIADQSVDLNEAKNIIAAVAGLLTAFGITYLAPKNKEMP